MTRRRRAFALLGLALLLGALAASDVAGREAALRRELGPVVPVVVTRAAIPAGRPIAARALAVRRVPARYAPADAYRSPREVAGLRAAVPIPAGTDLGAALTGTGGGPGGPPLRAGERVAHVVAIGAPDAVVAGGLVDVLVTRDAAGGGGTGAARVELAGAEVLAAAPAPDAGREADGLPRVAVTLRVTLRQAVALAAAQSYAREIRVLPRGTP